MCPITNVLVPLCRGFWQHRIARVAAARRPHLTPPHPLLATPPPPPPLPFFTSIFRPPTGSVLVYSPFAFWLCYFLFIFFCLAFLYTHNDSEKIKKNTCTNAIVSLFTMILCMLYFYSFGKSNKHQIEKTKYTADKIIWANQNAFAKKNKKIKIKSREPKIEKRKQIMTKSCGRQQRESWVKKKS